MVLAGKVFLLREDASLEAMASKLKSHNEERIFDHEGMKLKLITEVQNLSLSSDMVKCVFSDDEVLILRKRDGTFPVVRTIEALIIFYHFKNRIFLIVVEKKQRANNIANRLSKLLFITTGRIVNSRISHDTLKTFHEENFDDTKVIFFDDIDVPNVNRLSLYGSELGNTSLYSDYLSHGKIWYAVLKSKRYGYVAGVTRESVVTIFSKISPDEFVNYVMMEIIPLID